MTAGLAFFLSAVALVVAMVVHQSLSQRRRRLADQSSRLELLSSISTLEEVLVPLSLPDATDDAVGC